jgi:hypothetical protein
VGARGVRQDDALGVVRQRSDVRGCRTTARLRWGVRGLHPYELGISNSGIQDIRYAKSITFRDPDGVSLGVFLPTRR